MNTSVFESHYLKRHWQRSWSRLENLISFSLVMLCYNQGILQRLLQHFFKMNLVLTTFKEVLLQSFPKAKSLQVILCCLLWMVAGPLKQERCWGSSVSMAELMRGSLCWSFAVKIEQPIQPHGNQQGPVLHPVGGCLGSNGAHQRWKHQDSSALSPEIGVETNHPCTAWCYMFSGQWRLMLNGQRQCVFNCQGKAQFHLPAKAHVQKQTCLIFSVKNTPRFLCNFLQQAIWNYLYMLILKLCWQFLQKKCQQNPVEKWSYG